MEYLFSTIIDPATYETEGLCDGIDVRKNNYTELEDRGAIRAHQDWTKHIQACGEYRGTLGPNYSFMSIVVPECIPERLEIISYANEFAFMQNDITDCVDRVLGEIEHDDMMHGFPEGSRNALINAENAETKRAGKRHILQYQMLLEMMSIDRECALATMKSWAKFVEVGSSREHCSRFTSLEKYLPYRIMDVGEMFWYGVITFSMGLRIPDHEMETCRNLIAPAWIAISLQSDLYSWPRERDAAQRRGDGHVVNTIWILMQEHQVDVDEAQKLCRQLIKEYVANYVQIVKNNKNNESISKDLRKFIEAMQYSISGNVVWSLTCPRYNLHVSFNQVQLDWMQNGVPAFDSSASGEYLDQHSVFNSPRSKNMPSVSSNSSISQLNANTCLLTGSDSRTRKQWPAVRSEITEAPYDYVCSLPSKGVRDLFIDALNNWFQVPPETVAKVKGAVNLLHNTSLILDDFQDDSPLRRGKPSAHTIFGPAQAINSSSYGIAKAISQIQSFSDPLCVKFAIEQIMTMFQGQAMDLYWTYNAICPSIEEYTQMVGNKTGALFGLACYLIATHARMPVADDPLAYTDRMVTLLGLYFQIRDDYQNLVSADYTSQKGFCEDLDEGKYSLPLIHALQTDPKNLLLNNILSTRRLHGKLTYEQKVFALEQIKACNSLDWTKSVLNNLRSQIAGEIERLEKVFNKNNPEIKALIELLGV